MTTATQSPRRHGPTSAHAAQPRVVRPIPITRLVASSCARCSTPAPASG